MSDFKLELNIDGFNEVRRSPAIADDLLRRGMAVVDATGSPSDFEVIEAPSASRARVIVIASTSEGRRLEATDRVLTRAFDAARR